jgi:hypothetical protein
MVSFIKVIIFNNIIKKLNYKYYFNYNLIIINFQINDGKH